jgi:uncharacterized protein (DUF2147 family)
LINISEVKLLVGLLFISVICTGQPSIVGKWVTIDDGTNEEKSVVEIFEQKGRYYGRIVKIFSTEDPDPVCDKCARDDSRYLKKIIGMEIIKDMKKTGDEYTEGNILDPEDGKVYRCKLWLEGAELMVRGYWGPFYRTQTWRKSS